MITDDYDNIWCADTEVFAYDNLWVFKHVATGKRVIIHNDNDAISDFLYEYKPILCGYNFYGYDQYILKGNLCGFSNEQLKELSDILVSGSPGKFQQVWAMFNGYFDINLPDIIDLFHDMGVMKSLKELEGNMGMSIEESDIPFDIDRPLTQDEINEKVIPYCIHDVDATEELLGERNEYVESKINLADICEENPLPLLKFTNARILSEVFHASVYKYNRDEEYEIPFEIDISGIPQEVLDFAEDMDASVADGRREVGAVDFDFHGVPTKFGIGGIHSADSVPYIESSTDDRVIVIQDITSYYPSIILQYNYLSRAIDPQYKDLYQDFYTLRIEAKAEGKKHIADAAKLVLNTLSGAMGNKYNKMYDPMMPLSMRITGQLAIMDAVNCAMANAPSARFIQLNTDGWVLSVNRDELSLVEDGVSKWETRTGFSVDTSVVSKIIQRDVNNYVLVKDDGKVKAIGGTVKAFAGGDFKANSLSIVHEALVNKMLHDVSLEDTINGCDDLSKFQLVHKAGRSFDGCEWDTPDGVVPLHNCNRTFATVDKSYGGVYKIKNGKRNKVPNSPAHCTVDNGNIRGKKVLDNLDRAWYINLAQKRYKEFIKNAISYGGPIMADEVIEVEAEEVKPKPRRKSAKSADTDDKAEVVQKSKAELALESEPTTLHEALYKLQLYMSAQSGSVKFDGFISNIDYSYADTQQYKNLLIRCCNHCGLIFSIDAVDDMFPQSTDTTGVIDARLNADKGRNVMVHTTLYISLTFTDGTSKKYAVSGLGAGTMGNAGSIAQTNALRNFILNNFLLDNKGRDGDDVASNFDNIAEKAGSKYVSDDNKAKTKAKVIESNKAPERCTKMYADALYSKIQGAIAIDESFAEKAKGILKAGFDADGNAKVMEDNPELSVLKKSAAQKMMLDAEAVVG